MGKFKTWVENFRPEREKEIQQIWADTFKSLGVGGLADEDAAQQSLSKITFGERSPLRPQTSSFKGKQAVRKRLENGQIFSRLEKLNDPELRKAVEDTRHWLDTEDPEHQSNASTTVSTLMQRLFGSHFQQLIDQDYPQEDKAQAQVQPMPPKNSTANDVPVTDPKAMGPENMPPMNAPIDQQAQQPQLPEPQFGMPPATNPMPKKPAGAEMGLY